MVAFLITLSYLFLSMIRQSLSAFSVLFLSLYRSILNKILYGTTNIVFFLLQDSSLLLDKNMFVCFSRK